MYKSQTQDNCSYLKVHDMLCDRFTHTVALTKNHLCSTVERRYIRLCVCVCMFVCIFNVKSTHSTSKLGPFWVVPTTSKDCLRVKTWLGLGLGLYSAQDCRISSWGEELGELGL